MRTFSRLYFIFAIGFAGCYSVQQPVPANPGPTNPGPTSDVKNPRIEDFTASKATIAAGDMVDLNYKVSDAETVTIATESGTILLGRSAQLSGSVYPRPLAATTSFILTATNKDKAATRMLTVTVDAQAPLSHAQLVSFSAAPVDIMPGQQTTLSWRSSGATSGVITAGSGVVLTVASSSLGSGTFQVTPTATTLYTMTMKGGDNQEVTLTAAVNVTMMGMTGPLTGRQLFDQNVMPIMNSRCKTCHAGTDTSVPGPKFLGPAQTAYYTALTSDTRFVTAVPENSLLLLKGEHTGPAFCTPAISNGMTAGRGCTPTTEHATIQVWLLKEANERGLTMVMPPPTGPVSYKPRTVSEALTRFGACMQRTTWNQTYGQNQNTEIAYQNTVQGRCYSCHSAGTAGAFLSQNSGDTFDQNRRSPNILKLVNPMTDSTGNFSDLVPANRFRDKGNDLGHPQYVMTDQRMQSLNNFLTQTLVRFHDYTQNCGAAPPPSGGR